MKLKCTKNEHYSFPIEQNLILNLDLKETLDQSLYSYIKKREFIIECPYCGKDVPGHKSPKIQTFGMFVILNVNRFDVNGAMSS